MAAGPCPTGKDDRFPLPNQNGRLNQPVQSREDAHPIGYSRRALTLAGRACSFFRRESILDSKSGEMASTSSDTRTKGNRDARSDAPEELRITQSTTGLHLRA